MRFTVVLGLFLASLALLAACSPTPAAPTAPGAESPSGSVEGWGTYSNPAGFTIDYPPTWTQEAVPQQPGETFSTVVLRGAEGEVDLHWGVGFGGACPEGYSTVAVAEGELPTCYVKNADGTEAWTQINKELSQVGFSANARTSNADAASHDLILQILSTLAFPPAEAAAPTAPAAGQLKPLSAEECAQMASVMTVTVGVEVTEAEVPMTDPTSGASGTGCQSLANGTGVDFESPSAVVSALVSPLAAEGWVTDTMLAAGGPTGVSEGMRSGDKLCVIAARWEAAAAANCPQDQPITACKLTPEQQLYTVTLDCGQTAPAAGTANPASQNCIDKGGTLTIEARGDGGEYGVCNFEDNLQCEEWALMRGDCPVGGVRVTGYVTEAGRYCAITGGTYAVTAEGGPEDEQGTCTLVDGTECDAWEYYNGTCSGATE